MNRRTWLSLAIVSALAILVLATFGLHSLRLSAEERCLSEGYREAMKETADAIVARTAHEKQERLELLFQRMEAFPRESREMMERRRRATLPCFAFAFGFLLIAILCLAAPGSPSVKLF